jgi:hypothetical protein
MVETDATAYVQQLKRYGFRGPTFAESPEVAVVDQNLGCLLPCEWLQVDLWSIAAADGRRFGVTVAWLRGEEPTTFVAPPRWRPGGIDERMPSLNSRRSTSSWRLVTTLKPIVTVIRAS